MPLEVSQRQPAAAPKADIAPPTLREFQRIAELVRRHCGLELTDASRTMLWSRLIRNARDLECRSFSDYYRKVVQDTTGQTLGGLIDALTTQYTSFMREKAHFDFLGHTVAQELHKRTTVSIWSAGAATGEEPYSIVMCLMEALGAGFGAKLRVLATDISSRALRFASDGVYSAGKLQSLDPALISKYFLGGSGRMHGYYRVKPEVRQSVTLRRLNLIDPLMDAGLHSVIFCRNVMIYFSRETQLATVNRLVQHLEPGGYLIIGSSESLTRCAGELEYVRPAVYRKPAGWRKRW
jgi:chemotaxis protein methyltransferase CheR